MNALLSENLPIQTCFRHLIWSNSPTHEIEVRDIVLALDALVEGQPLAKQDQVIVKTSAYRTLLKRLLPKIEKLVNGMKKELVNHEQRNRSVDLFSRLTERLRGANDTSMSKRRAILWERLGFEPSSVEKTALNNRNPMSHKGFILHRGSGDEEVPRLVDDVAVARNLANRVVLTLLGYAGVMKDYRQGLNAEMEDVAKRLAVE